MTYEEELKRICDKDSRVLVMTAENRAAIRNLPEMLGDRFIDVGIAEQTMVGMAAGLALMGNRPVVHALAAFLTMRAFEFIRTDIGISGMPVKLVGSVAGFLSDANGPTHQAIEDISIMKGIPGMNVFCPADISESVEALEDIITDDSPWYIRYNPLKEVYKHEPVIKGKAELIGNGKDVGIFVYGTLFSTALRVKEILESAGLGVSLLNVRFIKPFDTEKVHQILTGCGTVVCIEDHFSEGGFGSVLANFCFENNINRKIININLGEKWFKPALLDDVLAYEGFTPEEISRKILLSTGKKYV